MARKISKKLDKEAADAAFAEYQNAFADKEVDFTAFRSMLLSVNGSADRDALNTRYGDKEALPARDFLERRIMSVS